MTATDKPKRRSRPKDDGLSSSQRNWKLDFARRHGITQPLLDPNPKPPENTLRGD